MPPWKRYVLASMLLACGMSEEDMSSGKDLGSSSSATTEASSSGGGSTTADASTSTGGGSTAAASSSSSSTGASLPEGPSCSVQVTSHGAVLDPLPKGPEAGLFPVAIGDALEDACGCHTLASNDQNVQHQGLRAPGATLFLEYADLAQPYKGATLGEALAREVREFAMPPGSCPYPSDTDALLRDWFDAGLPDGANYAPR